MIGEIPVLDPDFDYVDEVEIAWRVGRCGTLDIDEAEGVHVLPLGKALHRLLSADDQFSTFPHSETRKARRGVADSATALLKKLNVCDRLIAESVGREFADFGYDDAARRRISYGEWLFRRARAVMRQQYGEPQGKLVIRVKMGRSEV